MDELNVYYDTATGSPYYNGATNRDPYNIAGNQFGWDPTTGHYGLDINNPVVVPPMSLTVNLGRLVVPLLSIVTGQRQHLWLIITQNQASLLQLSQQ